MHEEPYKDQKNQGPKEQKLNHKDPSSSKQYKCLEFVSYEKWDKV